MLDKIFSQESKVRRKPEKQCGARLFEKILKEQKNFKKGIDFVKQRRYNVELYENNRERSAQNAQH